MIPRNGELLHAVGVEPVAEAYVWAFRPFGAPRPHAFVATGPIEPLGPAEPCVTLRR